MANAISNRIKETLGANLPFSLLNDSDLQQLAERTLVRYLEQGKYLFQAGMDVRPVVYFIAEGAIILEPGASSLRRQPEWCGEGDTFGIEAMDTDPLYKYAALAQEESLIYEIPIRSNFRELLSSPAMRRFFRGSHPLESLQFLKETSRISNRISLFHSAHPRLVTCREGTLVAQAARHMASDEVGSMLVVDEEGRPKGIVTDKDLRLKIATGDFPIDSPVDAIMSEPVITAPPSMDANELHLRMLRYRIRHICITEDGTPQSLARQIFSLSDLLLAESDSAALWLHKVLKSTSLDALVSLSKLLDSLLEKGINKQSGIGFMARERTALYDALVGRVIELTLAEMAGEGQQLPKTPFCWIVLGSAAREEQLLRTDQDNALLFGDVGEYDEAEWAPAFFCRLGLRVNDVLERCGFEKCPAGLMAGNPAYCLSLNQWESKFSAWIQAPTPEAMLQLGVFLDFRPVFGQVALAHELRASLQPLLRGKDVFWAFLAADALHSPPFLNFFRNLIVESTGEHKKEFDIKARALMPFVDATRVLALHAGIDQSSSTLQRLRRLESVDAVNRQVYQMSAAAFEYIVGFRVKQGITQGTTGQYCRLVDLNPLDLATLRNVFIPLSALQEILRVRFQTEILGI